MHPEMDKIEVKNKKIQIDCFFMEYMTFSCEGFWEFLLVVIIHVKIRHVFLEKGFHFL